jgi:hypothetical protein
MTETAGQTQNHWEVVGSLDLRADFQKLLKVSKNEANPAPDLLNGCQELVEKYRLYEVLKVEKRPGYVRLTFANLWRVTRFEGRPGFVLPGFFLHTFDLAEGQWREEDDLEAIIWRKCDHFGKLGGEQWRHLPRVLAPLVWPDLEIVKFHPARGRFNLSSLWGALAETLLYPKLP